MGQSHPITSKENKSGEKFGLKYGLSSMQGCRYQMEDFHHVQLGLPFGLDDWSFFAIFDGHAGEGAASFAACNLLDYILRDDQFELDTGKWSGPVDFESRSNFERVEDDDDDDKAQPSTEVIDKLKKLVISDADDSTNHDQEKDHTKVDSHDNTSEDQEKKRPKFASYETLEQLKMVSKAIKSGFLNADEGLRVKAKNSMKCGGCTAIVALVSPTHIFIANCGDSRAILCNKIEGVKFTTQDHKPSRDEEKARISAAGGTNFMNRVNGVLAVTRALGDFKFKNNQAKGPFEQIISPEPDVFIIEREKTDEFLILACDGVWDVVDIDNLYSYVKHMSKLEPDLENVCSSVLDTCLRMNSLDNMSMILVSFESAPKVSEEEIEKDKISDRFLSEFVDSIAHKAESGYTVKNLLQDVENLKLVLPTEVIKPPGVGLYAKYDLLKERLYKDLDPEIREKRN